MTKPSRREMLAALIEKGSTDSFVHYAHALEHREDPAAAYRLLVAVSETFPGYVPTYLMAAKFASEAGLTEEARRMATRGIDVARAAQDGHAVSELQAALFALD